MSGPLFERHLRPHVAGLRPLRHEVNAMLDGWVADATINDVLLVVSELCTNAIAATRGTRGDIVLRIGMPSDGSVLVEVEDTGDGFVLGSNPRSEDQREAGRGLEIAQAVADDIEVARHDRRTCVRARLRRNEALQLAGDLQ